MTGLATPDRPLLHGDNAPATASEGPPAAAVTRDPSLLRQGDEAGLAALEGGEVGEAGGTGERDGLIQRVADVLGAVAVGADGQDLAPHLPVPAQCFRSRRGHPGAAGRAGVDLDADAALDADPQHGADLLLVLPLVE